MSIAIPRLGDDGVIHVDRIEILPWLRTNEYMRSLVVSLHMHKYLIHKAYVDHELKLEMLVPRQAFPEGAEPEDLHGTLLGVPFRTAEIDEAMVAFPLTLRQIPLHF